MIRAQLVGATGYGGLGMIELLLRHPEIELVSLLAKTDVGRPLSDFFPHLRGFCDQVVEEANPDAIGVDVDLVIFSTPDRIGMTYAEQLTRADVRMIDYSGDFRFGDSERYQEYARLHPSTTGRPHACPDLLSRSVYGIPELYRERIRSAPIVGNPGCFAVAMILGLAPAVSAGLIDPRSVVCDGKTGSSGAGKKLSAAHHFPERNENLTPYRLGVHQHSVETTQTLAALGGESVGLTFVPHLLPVTRGILCTLYATLRRDLKLEEAYEVYRGFYDGEPFARVMPLGVYPGLKSVLGSNLCDISLALDVTNQRLIVVSAIDNLLKGQAGMALQNINVMFGFPETLGLERLPVYP